MIKFLSVLLISIMLCTSALAYVDGDIVSSYLGHEVIITMTDGSLVIGTVVSVRARDVMIWHFNNQMRTYDTWDMESIELYNGGI